MAGKPACTAIVVTFNSRDQITACLDSLTAQEGVDLSLSVVDNASADGTAALIRERFPGVGLEVSPRNLGFAQANNLVLARSASPFFALVNPDTVLPPGAILACLEFLEAHPDVGFVGTRLVTEEGEPQRTGHEFLGLANLFAETFLLDRFTPEATASLRGWRIGPARPTDVDWLTGAFLVLRRDVVDQVGPFDPAFFMYGEEMEWCYRARRAGWRVVYLPEPTVLHVGGASSRPIAGAMFVENLKGRVRFLRKHRGDLVSWCGRVLIATSVVMRFALREAQAMGARASGRPLDPLLLRKREMFRSALAWVLGGMRLEESS